MQPSQQCKPTINANLPSTQTPHQCTPTMNAKPPSMQTNLQCQPTINANQPAMQVEQCGGQLRQYNYLIASRIPPGLLERVWGVPWLLWRVLRRSSGSRGFPRGVLGGLWEVPGGPWEGPRRLWESVGVSGGVLGRPPGLLGEGPGGTENTDGFLRVSGAGPGGSLG